VVVFSNDFDAPGLADGPEHQLLVVPPGLPHLQVVASGERGCGGRGDATVHRDQLKPLGDP
jgi:hypothetical protein